MSRPPVMKFTLQLHKLPTCLERKCGEEPGCLDVSSSSVMNSVAGDALENQGRSLVNEPTAELQMQSHEHLLEHQQGVRRHLSEVFQKEQVHQVASWLKA